MVDIYSYLAEEKRTLLHVSVCI